jgi:magnesium-transporting ATPase (P-type)
MLPRLLANRAVTVQNQLATLVTIFLPGHTLFQYKSTRNTELKRPPVVPIAQLFNIKSSNPIMFSSFATFVALTFSALAVAQQSNQANTCVRNYTVILGDTCDGISAKTGTAT